MAVYIAIYRQHVFCHMLLKEFQNGQLDTITDGNLVTRLFEGAAHRFRTYGICIVSELGIVK